MLHKQHLRLAMQAMHPGWIGSSRDHPKIGRARLDRSGRSDPASFCYDPNANLNWSTRIPLWECTGTLSKWDCDCSQDPAVIAVRDWFVTGGCRDCSHVTGVNRCVMPTGGCTGEPKSEFVVPAEENNPVWNCSNTLLAARLHESTKTEDSLQGGGSYPSC